VLALGKRENFRVNVIEAFDEPWKRALEGTVGGHWGLLDDLTRTSKFNWGEAVSNHPHWKMQAAGGILCVVIVFGAAFAAQREATPPLALWLAVTANAIAGGTLMGWSVANVPIESLGVSGWLRSLAFVGVALLATPSLSAAMMRGTPLPRFSRLLGPAAERCRDPFELLVGALLIATTLLAILAALGLVFDPRYRDFPFAPMTAATVPFFLHSLTTPRPVGRHGVAEWVSGGVIGLALPYIVLNESFANWQSLWLCAALGLLALSLLRVRDGQS
jgi:hypothetical protein